MSTFVVLLHEDDPEGAAAVRQNIADNFPEPDVYEFSELVYLVTGPRIVSEAKEKLGIGVAESVTGAVLSLNGSFGGNSWLDMWDWLRSTDTDR